MSYDITDPIFTDENAAREHLERKRWPDGAVCPHCGATGGDVTKLAGKKHRPGVFQCNVCREQFTATVGTVFERSKIPLRKWLLATYLLSGSKKGRSSHQLHRMLGVTHKTAWFMSHRIREGMREPIGPAGGGLGGENKAVGVDETFVGGKARNAKRGEPVPNKEPVVSLVERDGKVRSFHLPEVTAKTLRPILVTQIDRKSYPMTDESGSYVEVGREFAGHGAVNHSIEEHVRGGFWHTNTVEGYFALLKRGIYGTYHHVSQQHLKRYVGEFDFRYNHRHVTDGERTDAALKGIEGKRLTYRRPDPSGDAPSEGAGAQA